MEETKNVRLLSSQATPLHPITQSAQQVEAHVSPPSDKKLRDFIFRQQIPQHVDSAVTLL
jgi:hypothetical protein